MGVIWGMEFIIDVKHDQFFKFTFPPVWKTVVQKIQQHRAPYFLVLTSECHSWTLLLLSAAETYFSFLNCCAALTCHDVQVFPSAGERSVSRVVSLVCRTVSSINVTSELLPTLLWWPVKSVKKDIASASSILNHMECFFSHTVLPYKLLCDVKWLYIPAIQKMGLCWKYSVAWFNNIERNKL